MRRVKTLDVFDRLSSVVLDVRDYRLMLAVVRAAESVVQKQTNESARTVAMCHLMNMVAAFNAKPRKP
jgi:hypothetical protein